MGFLDPRPKNHPTKKLSWKLPDKKKPDQNRNPSTKNTHQDRLKNNCFTHKKCIRTVSFREIFWGRGVSPFGLKHLRSACGWPWIPRPKIRRPAADPRPPDQKIPPKTAGWFSPDPKYSDNNITCNWWNHGNIILLVKPLCSSSFYQMYSCVSIKLFSNYFPIDSEEVCLNGLS